MLGDSGRSFVVGFGNNYPKQPHHKAAACKSPPAECNWSTFEDISQDNPHQLNGALVGGPKSANDEYQDVRTDYIMNEVTLDYNAGFQSAVAGLKAKGCGSYTGGPSQTSSTVATSSSEPPVTITSAPSTNSNPESTTAIVTEPTVTSSGTEQPTTFTSQGCSLLTTVTNAWEGNVQGKLKIVVPTDISSFNIELETDIALTNINFYTAIASPTSGSKFTLTNYDWFSGLAAGQILELDYQMTFSGPNPPNIAKLTLNGQNACSGAVHSSTSSPVSSTAPSVTTAGPMTSSTTNASPTSSNPESTSSSSGSCSAERYDYGEVLRLSNLFYEAQRSGDLPDDNRVPWRGDSSTDDQGNNGEDLSGGYHDGKYLSDYLNNPV